MSATDTVEIKYTIEPLVWRQTSAQRHECYKAKMPDGYVTIRKSEFGVTLHDSGNDTTFRCCPTVDEAKKIAYGLYIQQLLPFLKEHDGNALQDQTVEVETNQQ